MILIFLKALFALAMKMKDNFREYLKQNTDIQFTKEIEENGIYNLF